MTAETQIVVPENHKKPAKLPTQGDNQLLQIIERVALDPNADLEKLKALMQMKKEFEAEEARRAFVAAMTKFKQHPPKILKDVEVSYGQTNYRHPDIGRASAAIAEALGEVGISHRFKYTQAQGQITVSCILSHILGHTEDGCTLTAAPDNSGGKNQIQAVGSTTTYLERYTLFGSVGIKPQGMDDDGRAADPRPTITPEQVADLKSLMTEKGVNEAAFLKWAKVSSLDGIFADNYDKIVAMVERKQ